VALVPVLLIHANIQMEIFCVDWNLSQLHFEHPLERFLDFCNYFCNYAATSSRTYLHLMVNRFRFGLLSFVSA